MVEAAGVEPASENIPHERLHTYSGFYFSSGRSPPNRIPDSLSCRFNRPWSRRPESAVLLVDAPSGVAGISRWNGSCLSSYGVIIIVCDYMFSRRFTSGQESSVCSQCFFVPVESVSPPIVSRYALGGQFVGVDKREDEKLCKRSSCPLI